MPSRGAIAPGWQAQKVDGQQSTTIARFFTVPAMKDRDLFGGMIRLHILHHACHEPVFGLGIMEELGRHGYKLGAGTLYPILHGMEKAGYLVSSAERVAGRNRRVYTATESGQTALQIGKDRVRELLRELIEETDA